MIITLNGDTVPGILFIIFYKGDLNDQLNYFIFKYSFKSIKKMNLHPIKIS